MTATQLAVAATVASTCTVTRAAANSATYDAAPAFVSTADGAGMATIVKHSFPIHEPRPAVAVTFEIGGI